MTRYLLYLAILAPLVSCSNGQASPPLSPTPIGNPNPSPGPSPAPAGPPTITVTAGGFAPREVTIDVGGKVLLVNGDTRPHDLMGGLDPANPECPEIANAGFLSPGQSREAGPFPTARVCNLHSHAFIGVAAFQGKITIR